jgi:hypothetical protein
MRGRAPWGLAIFAVLWTAGVAFADLTYLRYLVRQGRTASWARADGVITSSAVTTSTTSKGKEVHGVALAYTYVAGGRTYEGTRYRVSAGQESGSWAADLVRQLPAGARVTVHHAPDDPSQAVLRAGLASAEAFPAFLLFPFNVAALGLWRAVGGQRLARRRSATGGLRVVQAGDVTRVVPDALHPIGYGLLFAAVASFLGAAVVAVSDGLEPPWPKVMSLAGLLFTFGGLGWVRARRRQRAGAQELVLHAAARTIQLPAKGPMPEPPIPWSSIADLALEKRPVETGHESLTAHWISLVFAGGKRERLRIATWYEREPAERFRAWLAARLGLPPERGIVGAP